MYTFYVQGSVEERSTPDPQAVIGSPSLIANISEPGISEEHEEHKVRMTWVHVYISDDAIPVNASHVLDIIT